MYKDIILHGLKVRVFGNGKSISKCSEINPGFL